MQLKFCCLVNLFPNKPLFLRVCSSCLENSVGKEETARKEQFLFPHFVFLQFGEISSIFINSKIVVCKLVQFRKVKFVVGKGLSGMKVHCLISDGLSLYLTTKF